MASIHHVGPIGDGGILGPTGNIFPGDVAAFVKRISWGAVFAGCVVAVSLQLLFTVLGLALGITVTDGSASGGAVVAAGIWWLVTGTLALLIGGMVLGALGGMPRSIELLLHGFTLWAVVALFGVLSVMGGLAAYAGGNPAFSYSGPQFAPTADGSFRLGFWTSPVTGYRAEAGQAPVGQAPAGEVEARTVSAQEVVRQTKIISWWTLFALLLGIAASVLGAWWTSPERIVYSETVEVRET